MAKTKRRETRIPIREIGQQLEKGIEEADAVRAAGLEGLQRIRAAKAGGLRREHARLTAKLGENHPRVSALGQKVAWNTAMTHQLGLEAERAKTPLPKPDPAGWILHGRVYDEDLLGMPGLVVTLVDRKGTAVGEVGVTPTEAGGYFKLVHTRGKDSGGDTDRLTQASTGRGTDVFVHVLDGKFNLVHADKRPITPQLGRVEYIEIMISSKVSPAPQRGVSRRQAAETTRTKRPKKA